jgi:hypothetical protein
MSIIGTLFSFNIPQCLCFVSEKKQKQKNKDFYEKRLMSLQKDNEVKVLPFLSFLPLNDIFPRTNHVAEWSVYIIGKNKRLVVSQDNLQLSDVDMLNKKYDSVLEGKNGEFFDTVFDMIVNGHESQFILVYQDRMYFANTYSFRNENKEVIGGILFIRLYSSMTELIPRDSEVKVEIRASKEYERAIKELNRIGFEPINNEMRRSGFEPA